MNVRRHAEREFTEFDLPHNRKEVFFDRLKTRFDVFFKLGLMLALFFLPMLAVAVYGDIAKVGLSSDLATEEEFAAAIKIFDVTLAVYYIPCLLLVAVGLAGAAKVVRQLIWGEGVFFFADFGSGIKQNYAPFAITFLLGGIVNLFDRFVISLGFEPEFVAYIPLGASVVFLTPIAMFVLSQTTVYVNGYLQLVKNAFKLFIKTLAPSLLFVAMIALWFVGGWALDLLSSISAAFLIVKYVLAVVGIIFLLPTFLTARLLFDMSVFDKYINKKDYPELVDKGLVRITDINAAKPR